MQQEKKNSKSQGDPQKNKSHPYKKNKKKNYFRKGIKNQPQGNQEKKIITYEICPICSNEIKKTSQTIPMKETQKNAHFECVISEVKKLNNIEKEKELFYLGGGRFGLIERKNGKGYYDFIVKETIVYIENSRNKKLNSNSAKKN